MILGLVLDLGHGNLCPLKRILISAATAVLRLRTRQAALRITVTGHGDYAVWYMNMMKRAEGSCEGCRQRELQPPSLGEMPGTLCPSSPGPEITDLIWEFVTSAESQPIPG